MRKILIAGGSSGIGKAIIKQAKDTHFINFSRNEPNVDHDNIEHHQVDVTKDVLPDIEDLDGFIYCPGSINLKPINSLKEDDFMNDFKINVMGAVRIIKQYNRQLKKGHDPSILMFSTVAVQQGMPFHSSIAAAKGAVEGLTRSLAAEFAPTIRVNAIAPTITDTPLAKNILRNEKSRENISDNHPLKRIPEAAEMANLANFLMSDKARNISGQIYGVDGGMSSLRP